MKLSKSILIITIFFLWVNVSWSEEAASKTPNGNFIYLSLSEVLQLAVVNNFDVQLAFYDRKINQADIDESRSIYDTVLSLNAEYEYDKSAKPSIILGKASHTGNTGIEVTKKLVTTGTDVTVGFQNTRESSDSAFSSLNPYYESALEMKFTQPLLRNFFGMQDWGDVKITKIDVANFDSEILDKIESDLAEVEKAYWDVVIAVKLRDIGEDMYERAKEFYRINEKKIKIGTSEPSDFLAAEANMETRKTELEVEEDTFKRAANKLKFLVNHPEKGSIIIPKDTASIFGKEIDFLKSLKMAFENRRDYKRVKKDIKAKKIKFNMTRNARWPQLDLEGSLILNGVRATPKSAAGDAFSDTNPEYFAKVTFSLPFEDSSAQSDYDKAKSEKAKTLINLKKVEKTIVIEVDDSVRKVNVDRNKAEQRMKIEELQRKKLEEEEKQFFIGRSDSDKIIRFQEDLLQAKILALKAIRDYKNSLVDLHVTKNTFLDRRNLTVK